MNLPEQTRVWVYQADEPFSTEESPAIERSLQQFAQRWVSHNHRLRAHGRLLHDRFVVLMVDESAAGASGCSIDASVAYLKSLGAEYQRDLFNRMRFSYEKDGEVHTVSKEEFKRRYAAGEITDETMVFDPLVKTKGELDTAFRKPLKESWHQRFV